MTKVVVSGGSSVRVNGGSSVSTSGSIRFNGLWVHRGDWDASTNAFPNGARKGYGYFSTSDSTTLTMPDGGVILSGTYIVAKIDNPATVNDWMFFGSVV